MKSTTCLFLVSLATFIPRDALAQDATAVLPVSSPAFFFSPGNWTGDTGRGGSVSRQTWNPGAYFRVTWTTTSATPTAELLLDTSAFGDKLKNPPELTYNIDGLWTSDVKCTGSSIPIQGLTGAGSHTLTVYCSNSEQVERWGTAQASGINVVRVTGLKLNRDSTSVPAVPAKRWVLMVGDSITEGIGAGIGKHDSLGSWAYFVGSALETMGYEYSLSACGWNGWLRPGDSTGDVPPYYHATAAAGSHDDARSRWNKIDSRNSLLDAKKRLSGYGGPGQEPAAILINLGTNEGLTNMPPADVQASVTGGLKALQTAAPQAAIFVIIPFGQYAAAELKAAVAATNAAGKISIIDLGPAAAKGLTTNTFWGGIHPSMRAHATFGAQILAQVVAKLPPAAPASQPVSKH